MKTKIKVLYRRNGTVYSHIIPNVPEGSIVLECLKAKIGRSEILEWRRIQLRAE